MGFGLGFLVLGLWLRVWISLDEHLGNGSKTKDPKPKAISKTSEWKTTS